jgi:hypothetical protein
MTIIVAFYGEPMDTVVHTGTVQSLSTPPSASVSQSATPSPASTPVTSETLSAEKSTAKPVAKRTSRVQLAVASSRFAPIVNTIMVGLVVVTILLWISKHMLMLNRVFRYSEAFAIRHPLIDIGLLVIVAFAYLLTQTAGLIL